MLSVLASVTRSAFSSSILEPEIDMSELSFIRRLIFSI